jgi:hypothetical protein
MTTPYGPNGGDAGGGVATSLLTGNASQQGTPSAATPAGLGGGNLYGQAVANANLTGAITGQTTNTILNALAGMQVPVTSYQGSSLTTQLFNAQQYAEQYYGWSDQQKNDFRNQMGLINSQYFTATNDTLANLWFDYVRQAADQTGAGHPVSPSDLMAADVAATNGGKGKAGRTETKTIDQVNLTNKADAQAIFYQAAQSLLGRAPTDQENAQFQGYLNAQERANPIQQVQQLTYNDSGFLIDKNVLKSSGGITSQGASMLAMQQARQNPEYGAYQAATTYMNALKQAIGG